MMKDKDKKAASLSFLSSDIALSIIQTAEMQYKAYLKFLDLTGNAHEAARQTEIYMRAVLHGGKETG